MRTKKTISSRTCRFFWLFLAAAVAWLILTACTPPAPDEPAPDIALPALIEISATPPPTATAMSTATTAVVETPVTVTAPPPTPVPSPTEAPTIYTVQAGDVLLTIADQFGVTVETIRSANGLSDANMVWIGQELIIPPAAFAQVEPSTADANNIETADLPMPPVSTTPETVASPAFLTPAATEGTATVPAAGVLHNGVPCPDEEVPVPEGAQLVGRSAVCGLPIVSYQLSEGEIPLILVGGIHGGYEWNTIMLAYEMLDYLRANPNNIPSSLSVYLIPNANPDGLYAVSRSTGRFKASYLDADTVPGRFNGRNVDLNRNWDCQHTPTAVWRDNPISGGPVPFSEPENQALRDYITGIRPAVVLFWHSAATGVYASGCGETDPLSKELAQVYGLASGYPIYDTFEYYDVTGDAGDWLASKGLPAISVELSDHQTLNWDMNLTGLKALLYHVANNNEEPG